MDGKTNFDNCGYLPFGRLDKTEYTHDRCLCCNSNKVCTVENNHICILTYMEFGFGGQGECKSSSCTGRKCTCTTDPQECSGRCGNFHDCICKSSLSQSCKSKIHVCICKINDGTEKCKFQGLHDCSCDESCNSKLSSDMQCSCNCRKSDCNPCLCDDDVSKCRNLYRNYCICTCAFSPFSCRSSSHTCICALGYGDCKKCGNFYSQNFNKEEQKDEIVKALEKQKKFNIYRNTFKQNKEEEKKNYMCSGNITDEEKKKKEYIICKTCEECVASTKGNDNCQCCNTQWRIDNNVLPHFCIVKYVLQTRALQTVENKTFSYKEFKLKLKKN